MNNTTQQSENRFETQLISTEKRKDKKQIKNAGEENKFFVHFQTEETASDFCVFFSFFICFVN